MANKSEDTRLLKLTLQAAYLELLALPTASSAFRAKHQPLYAQLLAAVAELRGEPEEAVQQYFEDMARRRQERGSLRS